MTSTHYVLILAFFGIPFLAILWLIHNAPEYPEDYDSDHDDWKGGDQ